LAAGTRSAERDSFEEVDRLKEELVKAQSLYNDKRFGVAGRYHWLVFAQVFLRSWSTDHLGECLELKPLCLADLIDATSAAMGRAGTSPTHPENIRKALANFRKNPANQVFCELVQRRLSTA
jgi:hypothetical protein